jgi:1,4-alpha-glucan branching enzyme
MSLKKQYLKTKPVCKVTFTLPAEAVENTTDSVALVGDFNDWKIADAITMERLKSGQYKTVIELEAGKAYQFRYLINTQQWENDWEADQYVPGPFGAENSVVLV